MSPLACSCPSLEIQAIGVGVALFQFVKKFLAENSPIEPGHMTTHVYGQDSTHVYGQV